MSASRNLTTIKRTLREGDRQEMTYTIFTLFTTHLLLTCFSHSNLFRPIYQVSLTTNKSFIR